MSNSVSSLPQLKVRVEAEILKKIVEPPIELTGEAEAKFRWKEDKLELRTVDGANVIKVEQIVTPPAFEQYDVEPVDEELVIGIKCDKIQSLLKETEEDEVVELEYNNNDGKMEIRFDGAKYFLAGITVDSIREPRKTDLDHTNCAMVHSQFFSRAKNIVGIAGSILEFKFGNGDLSVSAKGDTDEAFIEAKEEEDLEFDRDNGEVSAEFARQYIDYLPKFTPDDHVEFRLADDFPMEINANRADQRIPTTIVVAPRLDTGR